MDKLIIEASGFLQVCCRLLIRFESFLGVIMELLNQFSLILKLFAQLLKQLEICMNSFLVINSPVLGNQSGKINQFKNRVLEGVELKQKLQFGVVGLILLLINNKYFKVEVNLP
jgi:hypothetical protein